MLDPVPAHAANSINASICDTITPVAADAAINSEQHETIRAKSPPQPKQRLITKNIKSMNADVKVDEQQLISKTISKDSLEEPIYLDRECAYQSDSSSLTDYDEASIHKEHHNKGRDLYYRSSVESLCTGATMVELEASDRDETKRQRYPSDKSHYNKKTYKKEFVSNGLIHKVTQETEKLKSRRIKQETSSEENNFYSGQSKKGSHKKRHHSDVDGMTNCSAEGTLSRRHRHHSADYDKFSPAVTKHGVRVLPEVQKRKSKSQDRGKKGVYFHDVLTVKIRSRDNSEEQNEAEEVESPAIHKQLKTGSKDDAPLAPEVSVRTSIMNKAVVPEVYIRTSKSLDSSVQGVQCTVTEGIKETAKDAVPLCTCGAEKAAKLKKNAPGGAVRNYAKEDEHSIDKNVSLDASDKIYCMKIIKKSSDYLEHKSQEDEENFKISEDKSVNCNGKSGKKLGSPSKDDKKRKLASKVQEVTSRSPVSGGKLAKLINITDKDIEPVLSENVDMSILNTLRDCPSNFRDLHYDPSNLQYRQNIISNLNIDRDEPTTPMQYSNPPNSVCNSPSVLLDLDICDNHDRTSFEMTNQFKTNIPYIDSESDDVAHNFPHILNFSTISRHQRNNSRNNNSNRNDEKDSLSDFGANNNIEEKVHSVKQKVVEKYDNAYSLFDNSLSLPALQETQDVDLLIGHTSGSGQLDLCYLQDKSQQVEYTLVRRHLCCGSYAGPDSDVPLVIGARTSKKPMTGATTTLCTSQRDLLPKDKVGKASTIEPVDVDITNYMTESCSTANDTIRTVTSSGDVFESAALKNCQLARPSTDKISHNMVAPLNATGSNIVHEGNASFDVTPRETSPVPASYDNGNSLRLILSKIHDEIKLHNEDITDKPSNEETFSSIENVQYSFSTVEGQNSVCNEPELMKVVPPVLNNVAANPVAYVRQKENIHYANQDDILQPTVTILKNNRHSSPKLTTANYASQITLSGDVNIYPSEASINHDAVALPDVSSVRYEDPYLPSVADNEKRSCRTASPTSDANILDVSDSITAPITTSIIKKRGYNKQIFVVKNAERLNEAVQSHDKFVPFYMSNPEISTIDFCRSPIKAQRKTRNSPQSFSKKNVTISLPTTVQESSSVEEFLDDSDDESNVSQYQSVCAVHSSVPILGPEKKVQLHYSGELFPYNLVVDNPVYSALGHGISNSHESILKREVAAKIKSSSIIRSRGDKNRTPNSSPYRQQKPTSVSMNRAPSNRPVKSCGLNIQDDFRKKIDKVLTQNIYLQQPTNYESFWSNQKNATKNGTKQQYNVPSSAVQIVSTTRVQQPQTAVWLDERHSARLAEQLRLLMQEESRQLQDLQEGKYLKERQREIQLSYENTDDEKILLSGDIEKDVQLEIDALERSIRIKEEQLMQLEEIQRRFEEQTLSRPFYSDDTQGKRHCQSLGEIVDDAHATDSIKKAQSEPYLLLAVENDCEEFHENLLDIQVNNTNSYQSLNYVNGISDDKCINTRWYLDNRDNFVTNECKEVNREERSSTSHSSRRSQGSSKVTSSTPSRTYSATLYQQLQNVRQELYRAEEAIEQKLAQVCSRDNLSILSQEHYSPPTQILSEDLKRLKDRLAKTEQSFVHNLAHKPTPKLSNYNLIRNIVPKNEISQHNRYVHTSDDPVEHTLHPAPYEVDDQVYEDGVKLAGHTYENLKHNLKHDFDAAHQMLLEIDSENFHGDNGEQCYGSSDEDAYSDFFHEGSQVQLAEEHDDLEEKLNCTDVYHELQLLTAQLRDTERTIARKLDRLTPKEQKPLPKPKVICQPKLGTRECIQSPPKSSILSSPEGNDSSLCFAHITKFWDKQKPQLEH